MRSFYLLIDLCPNLSPVVNSCSQMEAAAVNLTAGDKPADVYSEIAVRYLRFSFNILT
jgi:hypothetical protein